MKFSCPNCGQHLAAESEMIGRQIDCPACSAKFTFRGDASVEPVEPGTKRVIKFSCSKCGQHMAAEPEMIGRQIDCPACSTKLTVGGDSAAQAGTSSVAAPVAKPAAPVATSAPVGTSNARPAGNATATATRPSGPAPQAAVPASPKSRAPVFAVAAVVLALLAGGGLYLLRGKLGLFEPAVTGRPSDPPVELFASWKPGCRYQVNLEMNQTTGYRHGLNIATLETLFTQEYTLAATNAPDGNRTLDLEIISFTLENTVDGRHVTSFDSLNQGLPTEGNLVTLGKLAGGGVRFLLAPDNKILRTDGAGELLNRAKSDEPGTRGPNLAARHFNADGLKQMVEPGGAPAGPMKIGEQWVVEREINAGILGSLRLATTNTFAGWQQHQKKKCARINLIGTCESAGNAGAKKITNGQVTGKAWFDPKLGITIESVLVLDFSAPVIVPPSRRGPKDDTKPPPYSPAHQSLSVKVEAVSGP